MAQNEKSLSHNFITDIIEDQQGNLWIATCWVMRMA